MSGLRSGSGAIWPSTTAPAPEPDFALVLLKGDAKHLVVLVMVGLGVFFDALAIRAVRVPEGIDQATQVGRIARAAEAMTILAAIVLLLTAVAQAA